MQDDADERIRSVALTSIRSSRIIPLDVPNSFCSYTTLWTVPELLPRKRTLAAQYRTLSDDRIELTPLPIARRCPVCRSYCVHSCHSLAQFLSAWRSRLGLVPQVWTRATSLGWLEATIPQPSPPPHHHQRQSPPVTLREPASYAGHSTGQDCTTDLVRRRTRIHIVCPT